MVDREGMKTSAGGGFTAETVGAAGGAGVHRGPLPAATRLASGPVSWLREIVARRDLLAMLVWREMKVKYKQSVMGFLWVILMPALIVSAGVIVKYAFVSLSGQPLKNSDIVSVAVRSVPWAFFVSSIRFASFSLISNTNLVTKIYMPRVIFPIASVLSQLIDLGVAAGVIVVFLIVTGVRPGIQILWLPVLLAIMVLLVTGLAIFFSAAVLFLRDVRYIVEVLLNFAIFFTPVFYEVSMFGRWARIALLNPVAPLLEGISASVLGLPLPGGAWVLYSAVTSVLVFAGGLTFFKRTEPYFAEAV
jgi:lipopolysaccharide transport system permease protein